MHPGPAFRSADSRPSPGTAAQCPTADRRRAKPAQCFNRLRFPSATDVYLTTPSKEAGVIILEPLKFELYNNTKKLSVADVFSARAALNRTRRKIGEFFEKYDLLLTPTTGQLPVPIGTIDQNQEASLEKWYQGTSQFNAFTNLFNASGLPAISLPLCQSSAGLPIGIQFAAGFGKEDLLIRVASAFEEALPWAERKPPVCRHRVKIYRAIGRYCMPVSDEYGIDHQRHFVAWPRIGTPQDVAGVVAILLSDEAELITGQVLSPNGGAYM